MKAKTICLTTPLKSISMKYGLKLEQKASYMLYLMLVIVELLHVVMMNIYEVLEMGLLVPVNYIRLTVHGKPMIIFIYHLNRDNPL